MLAWIAIKYSTNPRDSPYRIQTLDIINQEKKNVYGRGIIMELSPEMFTEPDQKTRSIVLKQLKSMYDTSCVHESTVLSPLKELVVDGFDNEQIWQELCLKNDSLINFVEKTVLKAAKFEEKEQEKEARDEFDAEVEEEDEDEVEDEEEQKVKFEDEEDEEDAEEDEEFSEPASEEEFTENISDDYESEEESIHVSDDMAAEESENSENEFGEPIDDISDEEKLLMEDESDSDIQLSAAETSESENEIGSDNNVSLGNEVSTKINMLGDFDGPEDSRKSRFEREQEKKQREIEKLENELVAPKSWTMAGEASSKKRPLNSLLEEDLEFEHNQKLVPIITNEVTASLEDMIKKRILDREFNDVERKVTNELQVKPEVVLDQEKSKKSLSALYEEEYTKQEVPDKLLKEHEEINRLYQKLVNKLDALSNFHYTPKLKHEELVVVGNTASIEMEEAVPLTVSEGSRLAPQEIFQKPKHDTKGESEMTKADKKRRYELKKQKIKARTAKELKKSDRKQALKNISSKKVNLFDFRMLRSLIRRKRILSVPNKFFLENQSNWIECVT